MAEEHDCRFEEVVIEEVDESEEGVLKAGMHVLIPCTCGETPLDHMGMLDAHRAEMQAAVVQLEPFRFLYHWAPVARRKQIERWGLRTSMRSTTETGAYRAPYVCLADSPSWAWALSGKQPHAVAGEWDLWQTSLDRLVDPVILAADWRPSGIYEVRAEHRIYKRHLWRVGSRITVGSGYAA